MYSIHILSYNVLYTCLVVQCLVYLFNRTMSSIHVQSYNVLYICLIAQYIVNIFNRTMHSTHVQSYNQYSFYIQHCKKNNPSFVYLCCYIYQIYINFQFLNTFGKCIVTTALLKVNLLSSCVETQFARYRIHKVYDVNANCSIQQRVLKQNRIRGQE